MSRGVRGHAPPKIFFEVDARRCIFRKLSATKTIDFATDWIFTPHLRTPSSFNAFLKNHFLELKRRWWTGNIREEIECIHIFPAIRSVSGILRFVTVHSWCSPVDATVWSGAWVPVSHGSAPDYGGRKPVLAGDSTASHIWLTRPNRVPPYLHLGDILFRFSTVPPGGLTVERRIMPESYGDDPDLPGISLHWFCSTVSAGGI